MAGLNSKGGVNQGIVNCENDGWNFKSGSTKTVSLRRSSSAKKAPTPSAAKATGGKVVKKAIAKKATPKTVAKFTPGKASKAKKSVSKKIARKTPTMGGGKASKASTSHVTMDTYKKMLGKLKK